jgi:hypothetical protein
MKHKLHQMPIHDLIKAKGKKGRASTTSNAAPVLNRQ